MVVGTRTEQARGDVEEVHMVGIDDQYIHALMSRVSSMISFDISIYKVGLALARSVPGYPFLDHVNDAVQPTESLLL